MHPRTRVTNLTYDVTSRRILKPKGSERPPLKVCFVFHKMVACIFQLTNAIDYILIISCFCEFFVLGRGSVLYIEPGEKREPPPPKKKITLHFFNLTKVT